MNNLRNTLQESRRHWKNSGKILLTDPNFMIVSRRLLSEKLYVSYLIRLGELRKIPFPPANEKTLGKSDFRYVFLFVKGPFYCMCYTKQFFIVFFENSVKIWNTAMIN